MAEKIIRRINIKSDYVIEPIHIVFGTNDMAISLAVNDMDISSYTAMARNLNDGKRFEAPASVEENAVVFTPTGGFFLIGKNKLQIELKNAGKYVYAFIVPVVCEENIMEDGTPSEATSVRDFATRAAESAEAAAESASKASGSENAAEGYATAAAGSASAAAGSEEAASWYAEAAAESQKKAAESESSAENWKKLAESFAHGRTDARVGEETDNAEFWAGQAKESAEKAAEIAGGDVVVHSEVGQPDGVASLDKDGKVPVEQIPDKDTAEDTVTFDDADPEEETGFPAIENIASGEKHKSIFAKLRVWGRGLTKLITLLGSSDISEIGDGTVTSALAALMADKLNRTDIVNDLLSTAADKVLSAAMGKQLQDAVSKLNTEISDNNKFVNIVHWGESNLNYLDNFSDGLPKARLYYFAISFDVGVPVLGGGVYFVLGFKTDDSYETQVALRYYVTGANLFCRSKYGGVWNDFVMVTPP